ncbi:protoporphyrinogen oxidase HemJ [Acetobacter sp. LMG 32666]|uniref:protoporphyrinogen oxidase HemJ n=1 Tax=Acetobacter sp. LMG 32666 TaxID=2959295 RepID=UPI0030C8A8CF
MVFDVLLPWVRWFVAFHIMSVMAWMAGLFYLPRLFVYHCQVKVGTAESARFKTMERRLIKAIMVPAMCSSLLFGVLLVLTPGSVDWSAGWWHVKLLSVLLMFGFQGFCGRWYRGFAQDNNQHSEKFYRLANEVPTVLMMIIVIMVVVRPF